MPRYLVSFYLVFPKEKKIYDIFKEVAKRLNYVLPNALKLEIKKDYDTRTEAQNRYLFGVVYPPIAECCGYTKDETHEAMKLKFNPIHSKVEGVPDIGGSTKKMSTVEFMAYVEQVCQFAAEFLSLFIPPPTGDELLRWMEEKTK